MKSEKEITIMLGKVTQLRTGMPQHSMFGFNKTSEIDKAILTDSSFLYFDWKQLDMEKTALEMCLTMNEEDIKDKLDNRIEALEDGGEDVGEDGMVRAFEWVLEDGDPLVSDEDIECFCKKEKKEPEPKKPSKKVKKVVKKGKKR